MRTRLRWWRHSVAGKTVTRRGTDRNYAVTLRRLNSPPLDRARIEGLVFNGVCGLYFLALAPWVREISISNIREEGTIYVWFGILVIAISLLEIYALPQKLRFVFKAMEAKESRPGPGWAFGLWLFHTVISILLLFSVFAAFGYDISDEEAAGSMPGWMVLLIVATVIKELVFLFIMIDGGSEESKLPERYSRPNGREWIADAILTVYACLAYTVTWETFTSNLSLEPGNPVMFVVNLGVSSLLFLMFYLPLRIPYQLEEMERIETSRDWLRWGAEVLAALVPALIAVSFPR